MRLHSLFSAVLVLTPLAAQVPDGVYVVSSTWTSALGRGPGGLFLVDPRVPGPPVRVQGLGADLVGSAVHASVGASAVAVRDDGVLWVGEAVPAQGDSVDLHAILLNGAQVATDTRVTLGVASFTGARVTDIAVMDDGSALVAVEGLQSGPPLNGSHLAIVETNGSITPLPTPALGDFGILGVAVEGDGSKAWFSAAPVESHSSTLYEIAPPAGSPPRAVGTVSPVLVDLELDGNGVLFGCSSDWLWIVDPVAGTAAPSGMLPSVTAGIAMEPATDSVVFVQNGFAGATTAVHKMPIGGAATPFATTLTGLLSDVALRENPRTYGSGTPGQVSYDWQLAPAPGGLPFAGNAAFGLQVTASSVTAAPGAILVSAGRASFPLLGVEILLEPTTAFPIGSTSVGNVLPLPIPPSAPLGARVFVQSFHLDAGTPAGLAATPGQVIAVLP